MRGLRRTSKRRSIAKPSPDRPSNVIRWLPLVLFTIAAAPAPETAPAPQPSPVASALPEIGRVRANAQCQAIFEHARVAITDAVRNDRSLRSLARAMDKVNPGAVVSVGTEQRR